MYCRNCGSLLGEQERTCSKCTYLRGHGVNYCPDCGAATAARARKCPDCGGTLFVLRNLKPRRRLTAGLLGIFLGCLGIHNFYLGYMRRGLLQLLVSTLGSLLTFGAAAIIMQCWALYEAASMLMGHVRVDADGNFLI